MYPINTWVGSRIVKSMSAIRPIQIARVQCRVSIDHQVHRRTSETASPQRNSLTIFAGLFLFLLIESEVICSVLMIFSIGFCLSRFVLNVPEEDQQSFERILFLVEYAYWYYEDNAVENDPSLKSLSLKEFTSLHFTSYKCRVPVTGTIILDETYERCLLVKGWKGSSWSFPRGKKSKDEEDYACAIREVLEETGFDVSKLLKKEEYIEFTFRQQRVRLFIVAGVADDTSFAPLTKKEISEIAWHPLDHLQPAGNEVITHGVAGLKLYMVAPFLASLKSWISKHPAPLPRRRDKPPRGLI
ncbi:hypothetical protein F2Q68_00022827 [Brassica cretica]|uniref:Nudix hydrolase domain-containing protein n=1 Tax=Brassica cretica TaxID=69181 RepID=A0A8S9FZV8_BRACR|nr:hypothetical protein F2Q68_00022827 [Brassica cretica]